MQAGAACGSVRNLVEASNLPVTRVRQYMHSKPSITKSTFATLKFMRMETFDRFTNDNWFTDLAYVDELDKDKKGVNYL